MDEAPYRADLAEGPAPLRAVFGRAPDGVRVRVALWRAEGGRGTVLLFPGRTEYIEKYGRVVRDLTGAGFAVAAIDWRGQGFSDRLAEDRLLGHVLEFADYQRDVAVMLEAVAAEALPGPLHLLAHSMGGAIGLRAVLNGLDAERAVFSAPMWGIEIPSSRRAVAAFLPALARFAGHGLRPTPGSRPVVYDMEVGFEDNPLTTDADHFAYFSRQIAEEEHFALGPPSLTWLGEALAECRALQNGSRPDIPALVMAGTDETVVSRGAIDRVLTGWPAAEFDEVEGARHELMMEAPDLRARFFEKTLEFLGR